MNKLLDWSYPQAPGYAGRTGATRDTSRAAAILVAPKAKSQKDRILAAFRDAYPAGLTNEEVAARAGVTVYAARSRTAELQAEARVCETDERKVGRGGVSITVWRAMPWQVEMTHAG